MVVYLRTNRRPTSNRAAVILRAQSHSWQVNWDAWTIQCVRRRYDWWMKWWNSTRQTHGNDTSRDELISMTEPTTVRPNDMKWMKSEIGFLCFGFWLTKCYWICNDACLYLFISITAGLRFLRNWMCAHLVLSRSRSLCFFLCVSVGARVTNVKVEQKWTKCSQQDLTTRNEGKTKAKVAFLLCGLSCFSILYHCIDVGPDNSFIGIPNSSSWD